MTSIIERANRWIIGRDTGLSSEAIWANMVADHAPAYGWSHPLDPSDLGRCLRLLEFIPEWKPRMAEMAVRSPQWRALVARWDEVSLLMAREVGIDWSKARSAPETYALMREIIASAGDARRAETGTGSVYEHATSHSEGTPPSDPVGAKE